MACVGFHTFYLCPRPAPRQQTLPCQGRYLLAGACFSVAVAMATAPVVQATAAGRNSCSSVQQTASSVAMKSAAKARTAAGAGNISRSSAPDPLSAVGKPAMKLSPTAVGAATSSSARSSHSLSIPRCFSGTAMLLPQRLLLEPVPAGVRSKRPCRRSAV